MTRYTPLWEQQGSYAASVDRRLLGALWPTGAASGGVVTPGTAMQVNISAGNCAVPLANNTGAALCVWDAVETATLNAANGTNPRIDLVTVLARGNDIDGGSNNDFLMVVITGTPAASPTVPAVPNNSVALCQILVPAGSATVTAGNITDVRPGPTAAVPNLGAPVTTGTTIQTFTDASGTVWVAKAGVYGGTWHKARDVLHSRLGRAAAFSASTAVTAFTFDTVVDDVLALYGGTTFTAPVAGQYLVTGQIGAVATAAAQWLRASVRKNGVQVNEGAAAQSGGAGPLRSTLGVAIRLAAADTVGIFYDAQATLTGATGVSITYASLDYLGTG